MLPMKRSIFLFLLVLPLSAQYAVKADHHDLPEIVAPEMHPETELETLDRLIAATEETLQSEKLLKEKLSAYIDIYEQYKENTDDRRLCFLLVKKAHEVLALMQELELTQLFDQQFLSEVTFFSNISERQR